MTNPKSIILVLLTMITVLTVKAQQPESLTSDSVTYRISKRFSVSLERAKKIRSILQYKRDAYRKTMQDASLKPTEKQFLLTRLMGERRHLIDSLLTPEEKSKLKQAQSELLKRHAGKHSEMEKRHETELNRIPHKRVLRNPHPADTIQVKEKTKKQ